ncbi:MAG: hypothetical protein CUN56_03955 [Phototrophicales bacterium]|nr:MAG: hypothetical protein CUN56_03955 [Phototrophicales bacterium]RMG75468.1 MAG: hypothetical protein D6711_06600 [Chloroflexota bacterium]
MLIGTACSALNPEVPTLTPTWDYTAPTIQPTSALFQIRPTEPVGVNPGQNIPQAASIPANAALPPLVVESSNNTIAKTVQIPLRNGGMIFGQLYESQPVNIEDQLILPRLPGVILLGAPHSEWGELPHHLYSSGYTVLVAEIGVNQDFESFEDVISQFIQLETINPGLIAVIGVREGADQALIGCAGDLRCDAVVLISPVTRDTLVNVLVDYNPRPLYIAASQTDTADYDVAQALARLALGEIRLRLFENSGIGTTLLHNQPDLITDIALWLDEFLVDTSLTP